MSFPRPIQWYHSHADLIWPDGTFKCLGGLFVLFFYMQMVHWSGVYTFIKINYVNSA